MATPWREYRSQWGSHREHRARPDARPVAKELVSPATGRDQAVVTGTNGRRLHNLRPAVSLVPRAAASVAGRGTR